MDKGKKPGGWITGKEVAEKYGVRAVDIGQACYEGKLQAFTEDGELIVEETKVIKVPMFPPDGVIPIDYARFENRPFWNWRNKKVVNQDALRRASHTLSLCFFRERGIRDTEEYARRHMEASFWYLFIDNEQRGLMRVFPFRFHDYIECSSDDSEEYKIFTSDTDKDRAYSRDVYALSEAREVLPKYKAHIEAFTFRYSDVAAWQGLSSPETELAEARKRISELEAENATLKAELASKAGCDGKGLPAVVCRMRREGKTSKEIAECLRDKSKWGLSHAQVGALLYTGRGYITEDSFRKISQNLKV